MCRTFQASVPVDGSFEEVVAGLRLQQTRVHDFHNLRRCPRSIGSGMNAADGNSEAVEKKSMLHGSVDDVPIAQFYRVLLGTLNEQ